MSPRWTALFVFALFLVSARAQCYVLQEPPILSSSSEHRFSDLRRVFLPILDFVLGSGHRWPDLIVHYRMYRCLCFLLQKQHSEQ